MPRGFLWGSPVAIDMEVPYTLFRVAVNFRSLHTHPFTYEYAETNLNIKQDAKLGAQTARFVIIDDVSATGGTASAIFELLQEFRVANIKYACVIDLTFLEGTAKLKDYCNIDTFSVVEYNE